MVGLVLTAFMEGVSGLNETLNKNLFVTDYCNNSFQADPFVGLNFPYLMKFSVCSITALSLTKNG